MGEPVNLEEQENELKKTLQAVQDEVIAEFGALDMSIYRQRLAERGLLQAWNALQAKLRPPKAQKASGEDLRQEIARKLGWRGWKRNG